MEPTASEDRPWNLVATAKGVTREASKGYDPPNFISKTYSSDPRGNT